MGLDPLEARNVSFVSNHDLAGRPGFKIDFQEVNGNWYLYMASFWEPGLSILDITDPGDPELVNYVEGPENTMTIQVQVAEGLMVTSLEKPRAGRGRVEETFAHDDGSIESDEIIEQDPNQPFEEGAYFWDVESNPENPELLGHYRTGGDGTHRNFYNGGDYAYMAAVPGNGYQHRLLAIVDVSDPTDPDEVAKWCWPGQGPDTEDTFQEYGMHGPAYRQEDLAFISWGGKGMAVLDVSEETDPAFVDAIDFGDFGGRIRAHSAIPIPETPLVAVNSEPLSEAPPTEEEGDPLGFTVLVDASRIYDSNTPASDKDASGRIISSLPLPSPGEDLPYDNYYEKPGRFGPHNQHHYRGMDVRYETNDLLVMTYFNAGLQVFDISDPLDPRIEGWYVPGKPEKRRAYPRPGSDLVGTLEDVAIDARGYIYCSDPQQGLYVLESDLL